MCDFPAIELLRARRVIAKLADGCRDDETRMREYCQIVLAIESKRLAHEDATGCKCWYRAIEILDHAERVSQALTEVA